MISGFYIVNLLDMSKLLASLLLLVGFQLMAQNYVPDQLLIQVHPASDHKEVLNTFTKTTQVEILEFKRISAIMNIYQITFSAGSNLDLLIRKSYHVPEILHIQKNHYVEDRFTPNDTDFSDQWHLNNTGQTGGIVDADIDAPEAWDITTGGLTTHDDTIVVCIIESNGADLDHEDLEDNIWKNYAEIPGNNIDDDNNGYVDDYLGWNVQTGNDAIGSGQHGTKVAGMVGAIGNNSIGVSGVNHKVKMMIVQGQQASNEATVIAAYSYPLEMRKRYNETNGTEGAFVVVTNASWGTNGGTPSDSPLWCAMYDSLGQHGIINVGATTNGNTNVDDAGDLPTTCPSDYLISVTSSNSNDMRANTGYGVINIDLAAPGNDVLITNINDTYGAYDGTSFATPCVSGAIALLYSAPCADFISYAKTYPDSAALKVRSLILDNVDVIPSLNGDVATGGRLNVNNSILELVNTCEQNSCVTPYGLTTTSVSDTSISLSWNGFNSTNYVLYLTEPNGTIQTFNTGGLTTYEIDNLQPCTNYQISVRGLCGADTSNHTPTIIVETDGCCYTPDLSFENASQTTITVSWNTILNATSYDLRYREETTTTWTELTNVASPLTLQNLDTCTTYEIQIKTICADSTRGYGSTNLLPTSGCGICYDGTYCIPSADQINTSAEWIESISINGYTSLTGNNSGYYYGDVFTNGFKPNQQYAFTFVPGYSGFNYTERFSLWIDIDLSGTFEDSEKLISNLTGSGSQSGMLFMPNFTTSGITRMRIAMNGQSQPTVCGDEGNVVGEYEDYCVQIGGNASIDKKELGFVIYPNPSNGVISIEGIDTIDGISIYNYDGQLVHDQISSQTKVNLSHLSQGIYIVEIRSEGQKAHQKLVIQ